MEIGLALGLKVFCNSEPPESFNTLGKEWIDQLAPKAEEVINRALAHDVSFAVSSFFPRH
jgi:hypothetical protein